MKNLKTRKSEGITLIALVITIIVLLILVGVSLSLVLGEEGLIGRTISAREVNENAEEKELVELAVSTAQIDGHGNLNETNLNNALKETFNNSNEVTPNSEGWDYEANKKYNIHPDGRVEDVGNVERILPKEYKQVKYIESSGIQYFLLENVTTADFGFDIDLYVLNNTGANVFGGFQLNGDKFCYMGTRNNKISFFCDYNPNFIDFCSTQYLTRHEYRFINNNNNKSFFYDDNLLNKNSFVNNSNCLIAVFSFVDSNKVVRNSSNETFKGRIYKFIIYDKNNEQCNLVPCYTTTAVTDVNGNECSSGTIGLYDTVNNEFYTNQGTGKFGYETEDGTYVAPKNN